MQVIFGIGNPGESYKYTYHNLGILFTEFLLSNFDILSEKKEKNYNYFVLKNFHIIQSKVYMNNSFDALRDIYTFYKFKPEKILVAHDELGLSKFSVKLKSTKGLNGHNGLRSIAGNIGANFLRLQFGIDHPKNFNSYIDVSSYVLSKLNLNEWTDSFVSGVKLLDIII